MLLDLLKYFRSKENYEKFIKYVKLDGLPKEASMLIEYLPQYFNGTEKDTVEFYSDVVSHMTLVGGKTVSDTLTALAERVDADEEPISDDVMQTFHNRTYAELLADEAIKIAEGRSNSFIRIQDTLDTYKRTSKRLEKELQEVVNEDMLTSLSSIKTTGMDWYIDCLNKLLGPLNNEFILIASRPDGGKTTLLANEAWNIARQLPDGQCVLWFNNEEHIRKVKLRVIQSYLGRTQHDVLSDLITAVNLFEEEFGKDKLIFVDDANHISKLERMIDKYNPGLIIVDQLYKVQGTMGSKQELEVERFRKLCEWARDIAKHTCPVIASNQLDGRAEGVKYPPMDMLAGSKTGAQGEADGILFIGKTPVDGDKRFLYTPKNKLTGSNEQFEAILEKEIARYKSL